MAFWTFPPNNGKKDKSLGSSLPEQKQKRNKITGTKTKTKQKYWNKNKNETKILEQKNKQTQNTGNNFIKEDIPSSPGEYLHVTRVSVCLSEAFSAVPFHFFFHR